MKSRIIQIDSASVDRETILSIAAVLRAGGIMAYPTETFYGLGGNCFSDETVAKIYALKVRDAGKPLSLIASDLDMVSRISSDLPPVFFRLAEAFWPGPLTIVLPAAPSFPEARTGPGRTVGVRIPPVPWLREVVRESGFPITATSANLSGETEISDPQEVIRLCDGKIELIVDGGKTPGTKPSTVIRIGPEPPRILREGAIAAADLKKIAAF